MSEPTRAGRAGDSQPLPIVGHDTVDIQSQVIGDIMARRELGIERYGTALHADNGRNALLDAYEEALDLTMYLKQALVEDVRDRMIWLSYYADALTHVIESLSGRSGSKAWIDACVDDANKLFAEELERRGDG